MKTPNYNDKVGKHPIPHAEGIAKDEKRKGEKKNDDKKKDESKKNKG